MELLTAKEVAELLKVQVGYIYQLKAAHKIPYIKIGGAIRFDKKQIEEWVYGQAK